MLFCSSRFFRLRVGTQHKRSPNISIPDFEGKPESQGYQKRMMKIWVETGEDNITEQKL